MTTKPPQGQPTTPDRDSDPVPVTVLGLGLMGHALAQTFLDAGHPTTVWNRTAAKAEALVADGAKLADSAADAVAASPLVVICVSDYEAAHGLLDPLDDVLQGRTLVNLTSGTSAQARETADWAASRGATYLDGAILAVPPAMGTADAAILYSGPQDVFDQHAPALNALAGGTTYLGEDAGLSSLYDVAILELMWGTLNAFLHGAALLATAGVDAATFTPVAANGLATVAGWLPDNAQQVDDADYPAPDATLDTHVATMSHLIHESEALGVNAELPKFIKTLADRAVADGHGSHSYAAMIEQFRTPAT